MSHSRDHVVVEGRNPGTERCKDCSWVFPCRDMAYCGHLDCLEFNAKAGKEPRCFLCHKRLTGPHNTEEATWAVGELRGHTHAYHYCCRDQWARLPQAHRMSLGHGYTLQPCDHVFADKYKPWVDSIFEGAGQTPDQELQVVDR